MTVLKGKLPADVVLCVVPSDCGEAARWVYHFLSGVGKSNPVMWYHEDADGDRISDTAHALRDYTPKTIWVVVAEHKVQEALAKFDETAVRVLEVSNHLTQAV